MFSKITKDGKIDSTFRELLGIPETKKMRIGTTMCMLEQPSNIKDLFRCTQNGRDIYYVVINPIDDIMAFCYSIYPC